MEYESMSDAVLGVVESMPDGQFFFGNELHESVAKVFPEAGKNLYIVHFTGHAS